MTDNTNITQRMGAGEIDLHEIIGDLIASRWLIAAAFALGLVVAAAYVWLVTPVYKIDSLVQVESGGRGSVSPGLEDLNGLLSFSTKAVTEIELLTSRMVIGKTIDDLSLDIITEPEYFPIIGKAIARRHSRLAGPAGAPWGLRRFAWGGERIDVSRFVVPDALYGKPFHIRAGNKQGMFEVYSPDGALLGASRVGVVTELATPLGTISLFVRELVAEPGTLFNLWRTPRLRAIAGLKGSVEALETAKAASMINVSLETEDPVAGVKTLNKLLNNYVRQNVERRSAEAQQTLRFLDQQLPEIKKNLDASEAEYNAFRARNSTLDVSREGQLLLQQTVQNQTSLVDLQQKRQALLLKFTPEHPSIKALDSEIGVLNRQGGAFNGQVSSMPKTEQEIFRLTRDLKVNEQIYTGLLNSTQQLKVAQAGTVGNVRVVDFGEVPLSPLKPKKLMVLAIGALLGAFLGIAFVLLRQALRVGVKDTKLIESRTGLPVFATIPNSELQSKLERARQRTGGEPKVLALTDPHDLAVESIRSLRTTLHFATMDAKNNLLMVAGPAPGVGKSFLSLNLAAVLAASGQRVLLIDADMRRGHINEYFGSTRENGLSDTISGQISLDQAIRTTPVEGMDLLTTGAIPPNPSELLLHENFATLLAAASARYDHVIVDCPPIMAVTDAAIVGRHVGASLMAVCFGVTPIHEIELAAARLRQAGVSLKGVILNRVETRSGYNYGYGYKYAYAYSYRSKAD